METQDILGLGTPIGLNDKHGNPIHIGDTLRFDPNEWYRIKRFGEQMRGEARAPEADPIFQVRIEKGEIVMKGAPGDMDSWCEIIKPWTELIAERIVARLGTTSTPILLDDSQEAEAVRAELDRQATGPTIAELQRDRLLAALEVARETLDNVRGDINPERGYADELEAEVSAALDTVTTAIVAAKAGAQ